MVAQASDLSTWEEREKSQQFMVVFGLTEFKASLGYIVPYSVHIASILFKYQISSTLLWKP